MATIHVARETLVSLLYAVELGTDDLSSLTDELLAEHKIRNKQKKFVEDILSGVTENIEFLDSMIASSSTDRSLKDIGILEKIILRIAIYEIYFTKVDKPVVINEAIELTRDFGINEASKFINGVLDNIK